MEHSADHCGICARTAWAEGRCGVVHQGSGQTICMDGRLRGFRDYGHHVLLFRGGGLVRLLFTHFGNPSAAYGPARRHGSVGGVPVRGSAASVSCPGYGRGRVRRRERHFVDRTREQGAHSRAVPDRSRFRAACGNIARRRTGAGLSVYTAARFADPSVLMAGGPHPECVGYGRRLGAYSDLRRLYAAESRRCKEFVYHRYRE